MEALSWKWRRVMVLQNTEASLTSHYPPPRFPPAPLPSTETAGHKEEVAKISKQRAWFTDESRPCGPAALSELWREPLSGGNGLIINAMEAAVCLLWKIKQYYPHFTGQIKFLWAYLPTWSRCCSLWAGASKEDYANNSAEWPSGVAGCPSGWCPTPSPAIPSIWLDSRSDCLGFCVPSLWSREHCQV